MQVSVNGKPMEVAPATSLDALLECLGVRRQFTAIALNREVAPRGSWAGTVLREGDRVEIVRPMGGG